MTEKTRINRVVTRTGDQGETGLADGQRLMKSDVRIEALGDMDELSACLGVLAGKAGTRWQPVIASLQQALFEIGAELALPGTARLTSTHVDALDSRVQQLNAPLPPLTEFILPGGSDAGAWAHYCRTVARRAERRLVAVNQASPANPCSLQWLNRLSDLLFVLARSLNHAAGVAEPQWQPGATPD